MPLTYCDTRALTGAPRAGREGRNWFMVGALPDDEDKRRQDAWLGDRQSRCTALAAGLVLAALAALPCGAQSTAPQCPQAQGPQTAQPRNGSAPQPADRADQNQNLSEKLDRSEGIICPPANVDPQIDTPPPAGGKTPVIPPPGSPGGDPTVRPKSP